MTEITSTHEMAEADWDGSSEPEDVDTNMVATTDAEGAGIEFHVSMRSYTQRDMEGLIIEAAAKQLVGRHNDRELAKTIEAKVIEQVAAKADAALASVTTEILEQPLTPSFGDKKPVTMREFLGLYGREYLTERVDREGKPTSGGWRESTYTRAELLVMKFMDRQFKSEVEKATNAAITEIRNALFAEHKAFIDAEKARFREFMTKPL